MHRTHLPATLLFIYNAKSMQRLCTSVNPIPVSRGSPVDAFILVSLRFATRMMKTTHGGLGTNVAEAF